MHLLLCSTRGTTPSAQHTTDLYAMWREASPQAETHNCAHAQIQLHRGDRPITITEPQLITQGRQMKYEWKPDRSGKYLTVVYKDVPPGEEVGKICDHPNVCAMSWSHSIDDVHELKRLMETHDQQR